MPSSSQRIQSQALVKAQVQPLLQQFAALAISKSINRNKNSNEHRRARDEFISEHWKAYFGEDSKLANWQKLVRDLGIEGDFGSISKCRKALKGIWVNIWDFLHAMQMGGEVRLWPSENALAKYTRKEGKYYPKEHAKEGGPIRALLARIVR